MSTPPAAPHGAFASEYYRSPRKSRPELRGTSSTSRSITLTFALQAEESSGALAIRGSIFWQLVRRTDSVRITAAGELREKQVNIAIVGEAKAGRLALLMAGAHAGKAATA